MDHDNKMENLYFFSHRMRGNTIICIVKLMIELAKVLNNLLKSGLICKDLNISNINYKINRNGTIKLDLVGTKFNKYKGNINDKKNIILKFYIIFLQLIIKSLSLLGLDEDYIKDSIYDYIFDFDYYKYNVDNKISIKEQYTKLVNKLDDGTDFFYNFNIKRNVDDIEYDFEKIIDIYTFILLNLYIENNDIKKFKSVNLKKDYVNESFNINELFIFAIRKGNKKIVELLMNRKTKLDYNNAFQYIKDKEILKLFIDHVDVNNILLKATSMGWINIIKKILSKKKINVNYINKNSGLFTPLMIASLSEHDNIVKLLIKNKADINMKNKLGLSALNLAIIRNNDTIIKTLLKHKADIKYDKYDEIGSVSNDFDLNKIKISSDKKYLMYNGCKLDKEIYKTGGMMGSITILSDSKKKYKVAVKDMYDKKNNEFKIINELKKNNVDCDLINAKILKRNDKKIIIMDVMDGDLQKLSSTYIFYKNKIILTIDIIIKLATIIKCLLKKGYAYSDLKIANILYKYCNGIIDIKLGDLGSICKKNKKSNVSTYIPPEYQDDENGDFVCNEKAMVWLIGSCILELLKIVINRYDYDIKKLKKNKDLKMLFIENILDPNPKTRFNLNDVISNFKKLKKRVNKKR